MARRNRPEDVTPLVYLYGARPPVSGLAVIEEQFLFAHRYRNKLCELDLLRREQVQEALRGMAPNLVALEEQVGRKARKAQPADHVKNLPPQPAQPATGMFLEIEQVESLVKQERQQNRSKRQASPHRERLTHLKAERKAVSQRIKQFKAELYESEAWKSRQLEIEVAHQAAVDQARAGSGLHWGTAEAVDMAAKSFRSGAPPRFRPRREAKDRLYLRLKGMPRAKLFAKKQQAVNLTLKDRPRAEKGSRRWEQRKDGLLVMTVGREGQTASIPLVYHRELPDDAEIRGVTLVRRGPQLVWKDDYYAQDTWSVHFTVETKRKKLTGKTGVVGVDLGWRILTLGRVLRPGAGLGSKHECAACQQEDCRWAGRVLRVAYAAGSDGREEQLCLPGWWVCLQERCRSIRSERDRLFDRAKVVARKAIDAGAPEEIVRMTSHLHRWRSSHKLSSVVMLWQRRTGERWPRSEELDDWQGHHTWLETWRARERHLREYESHLREQLAGMRLDLYRKWSNRLALRYKTVCLEGEVRRVDGEDVLVPMDLRKFHRLPPVEEGITWDQEMIRRMTRNAALSVLRGSLTQRMASMVYVDAVNTTKTCHACGHLDVDWTDHALLDHVCPSCAVRWDQDTNAARNLVAATGRVAWLEPGSGRAESFWPYEPRSSKVTSAVE